MTVKLCRLCIPLFLFIFCLFYTGIDFCMYVTIALEVVDLGLAPHWGPGLRANL